MKYILIVLDLFDTISGPRGYKGDKGDHGVCPGRDLFFIYRHSLAVSPSLLSVSVYV